MIELRALGTVELKGTDGAALRAVLAQPKRFALLVYLAVHHFQGPRRRDAVIALFWPELDTEHARGALRQALRFLRRSLGAGVLNGRSEEELGIEHGTLWCDATAFEEACAAARWTQALELYRGDFFDGFFVSGASSQFDGWVAAERNRLQERAVVAALTLAARSENEGDSAAAVHWARRARALSPEDEGTLQRLIALLDRIGDRAGAVRAYEEFAGRVAANHEVDPSPETQALIRAVRLRAAEITPRAGLGALGHVPLRAPASAGVGDATVARGIRIPPWIRAATYAAIIIGAVALHVGLRRGSPVDTQPDVVAVLPFRVSGASAELTYLREGMIDLLAAKLAGDGGTRVMSPRTVMRAWRQAVSSDGEDLPEAAALGLARRLGAGQLLLGAVVGRSDRLVLNASLLDVARSRMGAQASVTGSSDSLSVLIDQLAAQLLARQAGLVEARVATLTSTSLPALRAYLGGQAAYRRGEYVAAVKHFHDALDLDSTFALANLGLVSAEAWVSGASGLEVAWNNRARLNWRDRALLAAFLGPQYPRPSPLPRLHAAWVRALEGLPDQPEAWYRLGELYFHEGAALRLETPHRWASQALDRAVALDSTFAAPLVHLIDLAAMDGDTALVRRRGMRYVAMDSSGDLAEYVRWRVATSLGDTRILSRLRANMDRMPTLSLWEIVNVGQLDGVGLEDVERAAAALQRREGAGPDRWLSLTYFYNLALNRGRSHSALAALAAFDVTTPAGHDALHYVVLDALFGNGDSSAAAQAARQLSRRAPTTLDRSPDTRDAQLSDLCVSELWRVMRHDFSSVDRAIGRLRSSVPPDDRSYAVPYQRLCAAMLRAIEATATARGDASAAVDGLDSALEAVPASAPRIAVAAALTLARLREGQGDLGRALGAIRHRGYGRVGGGGPYFLATLFREEARLAALVGDRPGAARSYRKYLALRSAPEPEMRVEVEKVRSALARLRIEPQ